MTTPDKSSILKAQVNGYIDSLADMTDSAAKSAAFKLYLAHTSRFHHYSLNNQILIFLQCPHATQVMGYSQWIKLHRFVRKGEHGISILAPCSIYKTVKNPNGTEEKKKILLFKTTYVFDVSQTDGEPLPEPPEWRSRERLLFLENALIDFANTLGLTIERLDQEIANHPYAEGYYQKNENLIALAPEAGTITLIHEIAHCLCNHTDESISERELLAEAIAYSVSQYFSLPAAGSPNYIALSGGSGTEIKARMSIITEHALKIIQSVEGINQPSQY